VQDRAAAVVRVGVEALGPATITGLKVDRLGQDPTNPWLAGLDLRNVATVSTTLISNVPGYGLYDAATSLTFDHSAVHDDGNVAQQSPGIYVAYPGSTFTNSNIYGNAYFDFSLWANATATGDWWGGGPPSVTGPGQLADSADAGGPVTGAPADPRFAVAPAVSRLVTVAPLPVLSGDRAPAPAAPPLSAAPSRAPAPPSTAPPATVTPASPAPGAPAPAPSNTPAARP